LDKNSKNKAVPKDWPQAQKASEFRRKQIDPVKNSRRFGSPPNRHGAGVVDPGIATRAGLPGGSAKLGSHRQLGVQSDHSGDISFVGRKRSPIWLRSHPRPTSILPEDERTIRAKLENAIRAEADYDADFRIRRADGDIRFLRGIGHRNASGEPGEYVGVTMDITERKRAEEERERLRQLEAKLAHITRVNMMGELAAALAHEVKQPIAASVTSANALLRWLAHDPPDLERARAAAARVDREANRAADIINSLRAFYKTGIPGERQMVDVRGTIEEMRVLLQTEAARYSVTIQTEPESDIPNILADRVQPQQILMNLMLNGIEAMRDCSGALTISSEVNSEGQLTVSIGDTGIGLPAETAELIFNPFHTTKPQGTGMGLTITRSIVEAYGGRVWATANRGAGATFHFTLPGGTEAHP
jgi:signal transduction histidine kinase